MSEHLRRILRQIIDVLIVEASSHETINQLVEILQELDGVDPANSDESQTIRTDMSASTEKALKTTRVVAYLRDRFGRVLLHKRRHDHGSLGVWECPEGVVYAGETLTEAVARVLRDGSGLEVIDHHYLVSYDTPDGVIHYYRIREWAGVRRDQAGYGIWRWLRPSQLQSELARGGVVPTLAAWLCIPHPRVHRLGGE